VCSSDLTNASIAHKYLYDQGCYDGCYEISGIPREFIQKSVVGGRCMSAKNMKYHVKNEKINDFDAVKLYSSAMHRMGFLKGTPKKLKTKNYDEIKKYDGYFIEINIKNIGKMREFPLMSTLNNNGIRIFENKVDICLIVDKMTLLDLLEFQKIDFEIVRGYSINEGRNDKISKIIEYLFKICCKYKKERNPLDSVIKQIMNSSYGKTTTKPIDCETKIFNNKYDAENFMFCNSNTKKYMTKIDENEKWKIKRIKAIKSHFSMPHIGSEILSMSKHIMNEVMCLAEDIGCKIYYQDTDSMHINDKDIEK